MSNPFSAYAASSVTPAVSRLASHRRRLAALLVATALAPAALPLLPDTGFRIGITQAFAKENVTIDKMDISTKSGVVTLSGISITGSTLPRGEIESLLKAGTIVGLAAKLEKLDADRIAVGSIEWRMRTALQDTVTVYEGFEATGIKAGAMDRVTVKGGRQTMKNKVAEKTQTAETTFGRFSVEKLDVAGLFRWTSEADPTGKAPMKQLHGRYELESMDMKFDEGNLHFGRMTFDGFKARLAKVAPNEIFSLIENAQDKKDDKVANLKMLAYFLNVYSSFEIGAGGMDGFQFSGKDKSTGGAVNVTGGKISFTGGANAETTVNTVEVKAQDGYFKMKKAGFQGDLYSLLLIGGKEAILATPVGKVSPEQARAEEEVRKIVAEAAGDQKIKDVGFGLEGIDGDFPPGKDAKSKDRVKLSLASFKATMGSFVNLMPTKLDYTLNNLTMPVPANSADQGIRTLREFGIEVLDLSAQIKGAWDEGKARFVVNDIMADMGKFGRVSLKGELGNIPRPLFENPVQNWPVALMGGNVQTVTLTVDNKGGFEKMMTRTAGEQGKSVDQLKLELSGMAPMMIGAFMGGHPDGSALADALTKFIRAPGSLSVTAAANVPTGITVMDFSAASSNPAVLLQKLKITASAK